jgi:hypothetical protein
LDDLVDSASVSTDAVEPFLIQVLDQVTQPSFDAIELRAYLRARLTPESAEILISQVAALRTLLDRAPAKDRLLHIMAGQLRNFAAGQAIAAYLRGPAATIDGAKDRALGLPAPDPSIRWQDRYVRSLSWVTSLSLIDLLFSSRLPNDFDAHRHCAAWYFLDAVLGAQDHLAFLQSDLQDGIINGVALTMLESGPADSSLGPEKLRTLVLTGADHEAFFAHWAELTARALEIGPPGSGDPDAFYRALSALTPIAMLFLQTTADSDALHGYLRFLSARLRVSPKWRSTPQCSRAASSAEGYHSTTYSQYGSPARTHRVFVTRPSTRRLLRIPSYTP